MKKILLIQFRTDKSAPHERECFFRFCQDDKSSLDAINSLDDDIPWDKPKKILEKYHAIILGGSGEFYFSGNKEEKKQEQFHTLLKNIEPTINFIIENDIPTLGVCFGHQTLGYFLESEVKKDASQAKAGTHKINLLDEAKKDRLFDGLPNNFEAQYAHKDSLTNLPKDSVLLANGGEKCKFSSFRHKNNIYGVQFHPELRHKDVLIKIDMYPDYVKNKEAFLKNIKDTPIATKIIKNFITNITKPAL